MATAVANARPLCVVDVDQLVPVLAGNVAVFSEYLSAVTQMKSYVGGLSFVCSGVLLMLSWLRVMLQGISSSSFTETHRTSNWIFILTSRSWFRTV